MKAAAFANAPRNNFVDEHVLKKLELLRFRRRSSAPTRSSSAARTSTPAASCPKPDEVNAFLADNDPKKRAKLIDKLLDRPEFVDYWSYKWSDLLLVSSRKLPQPAMWAFYRKLRQSVADNKPWDQFARDILTASGSSLTNGAGNYFVLHKDVSELAETDRGHVPRHVDRLREVPQPPAGEVDAGPILGASRTCSRASG